MDFLFEILDRSDTNFTAHVEDRKSMSQWSMYLSSGPVRENSHQQNCVSSLVLVAACECAQDRIWVRQVLKSLNLQVKLPMLLYVDNNGGVDLVNNWNIGGHTRHVDV